MKPFLLFMIVVVIALQGVASGGQGVASPHSEEGDCALCHVASADKLRSWFAFSATKRELRVDLNQVCQQCHTVQGNHAGGFFGVGIGHATGKPTKLNLANLPLAPDGTITCAVTCHSMHSKSLDQIQNQKHLRLPPDALCRSCHNL